MEKFSIRIASIPNIDIDANEKNIAFLERMAQKNGDWFIEKENLQNVRPIKFGSEILAGFKLSKFIKAKHVSIEVYYTYRADLSDSPIFDDFIYMELKKPEKINYEDFVRLVLPNYIEFFDAYSVKGFTESQVYWEAKNIPIEIKRRTNPRNSILSFNSIMYLDEKLCFNALGMSSQNVLEKVTPHVYRCTLISGGILIIAGDHWLNLEESLAHDRKMRSLLGFDVVFEN